MNLASAPGRELLDDPASDPSAAAESLRNIARANRWFGGRSALENGLERLLGSTPRGSVISLLDIGTGSGDLPAAAVRWGAGRGIRITPVGLERHPTAARLARASGVPVAVGCAGIPPFRDRSVDVVLVSQLAHHFDGEVQRRLFIACDRIARRGVIISDLRRSELATAGFWIAARLLRFDPATRADGITSIRRGFSRGELVAQLGEAGIEASVVRRPWFRFLVTWRTGEP